MKKIFSIVTVLVFSAIILMAQAPESFKYQTVVRDVNGYVISNQQVTITLDIIRGNINGTVVCSENFNPMTNEFGLVNLEVGSQDTTAFKNIDWANGPYFLQIELNGNLMGTSELLSVPYALYARSAGNPVYWMPQVNGIYYNEGNVGMGSPTPDSSAQLEISSTTRGFLPPRMTSSEIMKIKSPANGLVVFCTTDNKFYAYITESGVWKEILFGYGTISPQDSCGYTMTINHIKGAVAPVTKTTTYGTVTNVPGEPSRCWISSNLGADHQAITLDDATEESSGWYWQFNRKQGYKHDGINRTPNTNWINPISENSDWLGTNDPCILELGNGWRIPTQSEWVNVNDAGGWEDWNGPWDSALKLHSAGYLNNTGGSLVNRGIQGNFWSNLQGANTTGWYERFRNDLCGYAGNEKAFGFSVRCIRN
jgi:hypothetical protein